ncbi:Hypothetical predicted protein [Cloeon dipterum]|uniref:Uncharacterized protein n=1 Tax=Cloeon dipterum TaxID=197152 RepID=A0A8S1BZZ2_9INSE|nr:Hypothetical predicted protein [Cloeon dipterum]
MISRALKYIVFYVFLIYIFYGIDPSENAEKEMDGTLFGMLCYDRYDVFLESLYHSEKGGFKDLPNYRLWQDQSSRKFISLENYALSSKGAVVETEPKFAGVFKLRFAHFSWEFPLFKIAEDSSQILKHEQKVKLQPIVFSTKNLMVKISFLDAKQISLIALALPRDVSGRPTHLSVKVQNEWFSQTIPKTGCLFQFPIENMPSKVKVLHLNIKNENDNTLMLSDFESASISTIVSGTD